MLSAVQNQYHKIANKILQNKSIFIYPIKSIIKCIDFIMYIITGSNFHIKRSKVCGKVYFYDKYICIADFNNLLDYTKRTQSGTERLSPMFFIPMDPNPDNFKCPFTRPSVVTNENDHKIQKGHLLHLKNKLDKNQICIHELSDSADRLIKDMMTDNKLKLTLSDIFFKTFLYKQLYGVSIKDTTLFTQNIRFSIFFLLNQLTNTLIKPGKEYIKIVENLASEIGSQLDISIEDSFVLINMLEITVPGIMSVLYETFKNLENNGETVDDSSLRNYIIESTRFLKYHPGITLIETCKEDFTIQQYKIKSGTNILRNIPACQHDSDSFVNPTIFNSDRENLNLVYETLFSGKINNNPDNRACLFQRESFLIVETLIKVLVNKYQWDDITLIDGTSPELLFNNIREK
jgi:hypothetical protein